MEKNNKLSNISLILLVVDVILLIGLYVAMIPTRNAFQSAYAQGKTMLPPYATIALYGNYIVIFAFLILLIKEWLKNKIVTIIINVAILLLIFPILSFYSYIANSPLGD